jgi:hypothetical protein
LKSIFYLDRQVETIETDWDEVCDLVHLSEADHHLWVNAFLHPYAIEGYRR